MSSTAANLLQNAVDEGAIAAASLQALNLVDVGGAINAGMGVAINNIKGETLLVSTLIDDSGSIRFVAGNTEAVRDGHNLVLDALAATKQNDSILVTCRYLNGKLLYPFSTLDQAIRLDKSNYNPSGGTPLYDETLVILGTIIAKQQEFSENGQLARTATLLISDGHDEGSRRAGPRDVCKVVEDMLKAETHIIAAMGVDDGSTDFRKIFAEMGVQDEWILTPKNTPSEIRAAFRTFSQSAVRASQGGGSFSQVAIGGFGAP